MAANVGPSLLAELSSWSLVEMKSIPQPCNLNSRFYEISGGRPTNYYMRPVQIWDTFSWVWPCGNYHLGSIDWGPFETYACDFIAARRLRGEGCMPRAPRNSRYRSHFIVQIFELADNNFRLRSFFFQNLRDEMHDH